jgi:lipopolysaccharide heptosyltransferase II
MPPRNDKPSILIVLIAGIGDLVLASKAMRAVRNGYPDADIHLLTSTEASILAQNYKFIDHVWTFPIRELRHSKRHLIGILTIIRNLRKINFLYAINLYMVASFAGAMKMGLLFSLLKSQNKIGHGNKWFSLFLNARAPRNTFQNRHIVDAMVGIALLAGAAPDEAGIEVHWDKDCEAKWNDLLPDKSADALIGINPGGDRDNRRWRPDRYAIVADILAETFGARILLLGGPGEEGISRIIEDQMKNKPVNLAGRLSLNELVYIISRLTLLITNDSGPMHIAAATKTPLVALFGPEDPALLGPYTSANLYRVISKLVDCRPCNKAECHRPRCLDLITPQEVFDKCSELLSKN